ncbi:MAG: hypothetical protein E2O92_08505 [Alphaproteobacteria bacterium]|nr:MAG: hypothetical protein E2O92_08505 [Alphaproteobacteria bacterium]
MPELYALPDHDVVNELLPGIQDTRLETADAINRIAANKGIVPLAINHNDGGSIYWGDIGTHVYREWQYMFTVQNLADRGEIKDPFVTDMDVLRSDDIIADSLSPSGLIFHISRCGSTLLGKALARTPHHIVINQGGPLQRGFWAWLTDDFAKEAEASEENLAMFRRLVGAMTRPRTGIETASFMKFISWNALYMDFVHQAYPDTPTLFLYRDPVEVIASVLKETTAVLVAKDHRQAEFLTGRTKAEIANMSDVEFLAICFSRYFETALSRTDDIKMLNYTNINAGRFPDIVDLGLEYSPDPTDMAPMLEQFNFHSKDDGDSAKFQDDSATKQKAITDQDRQLIEKQCAGLVDRLDASPYNVFK